jgi:hypothetical protein
MNLLKNVPCLLALALTFASSTVGARGETATESQVLTTEGSVYLLKAAASEWVLCQPGIKLQDSNGKKKPRYRPSFRFEHNPPG